MKRQFAHTTKDGRPVLETCLCEDHNTQDKQQELLQGLTPGERRNANGNRIEVTADPDGTCRACGSRGPRSQGGQFMCGLIGTMPRMPDSWAELPSYSEAMGEWRDEVHERLVADIGRFKAVFDMVDGLIQAAQSKPEVWGDKDVGGKLQALALFLMRT